MSQCCLEALGPRTEGHTPKTGARPQTGLSHPVLLDNLLVLVSSLLNNCCSLQIMPMQDSFTTLQTSGLAEVRESSVGKAWGAG